MKRSKKHQVIMVAPNYLVELGLAPAIRIVGEHNTQAEADAAVKAIEDKAND